MDDKTLNLQTLDDLHEACQHIEWLIRYVRTSESSNALGVVLNAKQFLDLERIKSMRVIRAQIEMRLAMMKPST